MQIDFSSTPKVFLCGYENSNLGAQYIHELTNVLENAGALVAGEMNSIRPNHNSRNEIRKTLNESVAAIILLIDSDRGESRNMEFLWGLIQERAWQDDDFKVLPILSTNGYVPPFLRRWRALIVEAADIQSTMSQVVELLELEENTSDSFSEGEERRKAVYDRLNEYTRSGAETFQKNLEESNPDSAERFKTLSSKFFKE